MDRHEHGIAGGMTATTETPRTAEPPSNPYWRPVPWWHPERWLRPYNLVTGLFKLAGLYRRGWNNAHRIMHRALTWRIPGLPRGLSGFRILFLSDLHLDGPTETTERLLDLLPGLEADVAILGGDYRWFIWGSSDGAAHELSRLVPVLKCPYGLYGVLGNHDDPAFLGTMRDMGIRALANEAEPLRVNGEELWLVGLEDCHFWLRDDLSSALGEVPEDATTLVLGHAQESVPEAARRGCTMYLAGHTHWGQIALPGGVPVITHSTPGRKYAKGFWELDGLHGYTSSGAGVTGLPLRFNSHSEVVTLTLQPA